MTKIDKSGKSGKGGKEGIFPEELVNGRAQVAVSDLWHENCNDTSILKLRQFLKKCVPFKDKMVAQLDMNMDVLADNRKNLGSKEGTGGKPDFTMAKMQRIEATVKTELEKTLGLEVKMKDLQTWRQHIDK